MLASPACARDAGIPYEAVIGPLRRGKRDEVERISGQRRFPAIELEDGSAHRAGSKEMAATIRAGRLEEMCSGGSSSV